MKAQQHVRLRKPPPKIFIAFFTLAAVLGMGSYLPFQHNLRMRQTHNSSPSVELDGTHATTFSARLQLFFSGLHANQDQEPSATQPQLKSIPKVALLFLTQGDLPHSATWLRWLQSADGLVPTSHFTTACSQYPAFEKSVNSLNTTPWWSQHLYTVYIHTKPNFQFPTDSPWSNHRLAEPIWTAWGSHSLMAAGILLLEEAFKDPDNAWFLLISESDLPLHDPLTTWSQLMSQSKSYTNACPWERTMPERWHPLMETERLKLEHWRKASQWFGLMRKHVEAVLKDEEVIDKFEKHCATTYNKETDEKHSCISDEHYIPTLFAVLGIEDETNCDSLGICYTDWGEERSHPRSFEPGHITAELIQWQRKASQEDVDMAHMTARERFKRLSDASCRNYLGALPTLLRFIQPSKVRAFAPLNATAKLTGRKFPAWTADTVYSLYNSESSGLRILDTKLANE